jgi:hypothetical protein
VVVGAEDADEVDFDEGAAPKRRKTLSGSERIRISQEEKQVYELVDGRKTVGDIVEVSRLSEFDTNKALYELLTRDLIEEVRGQALAAVEATPVDETEVAETPVPLPLVLVLAVLAIASIATSFRNPLNSLQPLKPVAGRSSTTVEARKAISVERIHTLGDAIEQYNVVNGHLPIRLQDLTPFFISASVLHDPWGNAYRYLQQPARYLVIGFSPDGKPDTDLFLSRAIDTMQASAPSKQEHGGIVLID